MEQQEIYMTEAECTIDAIRDLEDFVLPDHIAVARCANAHKMAKKINWYRKTHLVYDEDGDLLTEDFVIDERGDVSLNRVIYFINNVKWDNGIYATIAEYNKQFENWTIIPKSERIRLKV